jgi:hypothetical protein
MLEIIEIAGKNIQITKIDAVRYKDGHPMGVDTGFTSQGTALNDIIVGDFFYMEKGLFRSSPVTEIIDENTFKTRNSIYKVEELVDFKCTECEETFTVPVEYITQFSDSTHCICAACISDIMTDIQS